MRSNRTTDSCIPPAIWTPQIDQHLERRNDVGIPFGVLSDASDQSGNRRIEQNIRRFLIEALDEALRIGDLMSSYLGVSELDSDDNGRTSPNDTAAFAAPNTPNVSTGNDESTNDHDDDTVDTEQSP
jgi:hypothetical protein